MTLSDDVRSPLETNFTRSAQLVTTVRFFFAEHRRTQHLVAAASLLVMACAQGEAIDNSGDFGGTSTTTAGTDTQSSATSHASDHSETDTGGSNSGTDENCDDEIINQDESDLDCGGVVCMGCDLGQMCNKSSDCLSRSCANSICVAPSCTDNAQNGEESDVDCGEVCPLQCEAGEMCFAAADCQSQVCENGLCRAPTCTDKVKNGDETDVDCGGSCSACLPGEDCVENSDCISQICEDGTCTDVDCVDDSDCSNLDSACMKGTCDTASHTCSATAANENMACDSGQACIRNETCKAGSCQGGMPLDCSSLSDTCNLGICDPESDACTTQAIEYFRETFSVVDGETFEDRGWSIAPQSDWQVGALSGSPLSCGTQGADPTSDHTAENTDNFVLGTAINACVEAVSHGYECVTSPFIKLDASISAIDLEFWSHTHTLTRNEGFYHAINFYNFDSSSDPYEARYEGWDTAMNSPQWQLKSYTIDDLSLIRSGVRFQFCFARTVATIEIAGDNIDDVRVLPAGCGGQDR
jgi:hypothetical protein